MSEEQRSHHDFSLRCLDAAHQMRYSGIRLRQQTRGRYLQLGGAFSRDRSCLQGWRPHFVWVAIPSKEISFSGIIDSFCNIEVMCKRCSPVIKC